MRLAHLFGISIGLIPFLASRVSAEYAFETDFGTPGQALDEVDPALSPIVGNFDTVEIVEDPAAPGSGNGVLQLTSDSGEPVGISIFDTIGPGSELIGHTFSRGSYVKPSFRFRVQDADAGTDMALSVSHSAFDWGGSQFEDSFNLRQFPGSMWETDTFFPDGFFDPAEFPTGYYDNEPVQEGDAVGFTLRLKPSGDPTIYVDDLSLAIVPEPASLALLSLGGLSLLRRRGRRRV